MKFILFVQSVSYFTDSPNCFDFSEKMVASQKKQDVTPSFEIIKINPFLDFASAVKVEVNKKKLTNEIKN